MRTFPCDWTVQWLWVPAFAGMTKGERRVHPESGCSSIFRMNRNGTYVYILASKRHGTLYVGVTNDIVRRIIEHREGKHPGFAARYGVNRLVGLESYDTMPEAIAREKAMKEWKRDWKVRRIEQNNPLWEDLAQAYFGLPGMPQRVRREPRPHPD